MAKPSHHLEISDRDYQDRDIRIRVILIAITVTLAVVALAFVAMKYMFGLYDRHMYEAEVPISPLALSRELPPEPVLQVNEAYDLKEHRAYEDSKLNHFAWVNLQEGTVSIPIQRALEILAKKGLPIRPQRGESNPNFNPQQPGLQDTAETKNEASQRP